MEAITPFCTNRNPITAAGAIVDFGRHFHPEHPNELRYGQVRITIPDDVLAQREGRKLARWVARRGTHQVECFAEDLEAGTLGSVRLFQELKRAMDEGQTVIAYLHGYNMRFRDAIGHAVGLTQALQGQGVPALVVPFSWPSDGSSRPRAYSADLGDAEASAPAVARAVLKTADFLMTIEEECHGRLVLLAHSMGNFALRHGLQKVLQITHDHPPRVFDDVILMAANEDVDAFDPRKKKLALLPLLTRRVHIYVNAEDRALMGADKTKGRPPQLGREGPLSLHQLPARVHVVDATPVIRNQGGFLEHTYFMDRGPVLTDLAAVIQGEAAETIPGRRQTAPAAYQLEA